MMHSVRLLLLLQLSLSIANVYSATERTIDNVSTPKIVGGRVADPARFPYFTNIQILTPRGSFRCGGAIIHSDIVITAGHCYQDDTTAMNAFVNMTSRSLDGSIREEVTDWRLHPGFERNVYRHDVMVMKLARRVEHDDLEFPKLNANHLVPADDEELQVIGLGVLEEDGFNFPQALQVVDLNVISSHICENQFMDGVVDGLSQVCAAAPGRDSCQGDSGGPLVSPADNGGDDLITGLVSFGSGCAREGVSSVNARISYFYEWIWEQACELSDAPPLDLCNRLFMTNLTNAPTSRPTMEPTKEPTMAPSMTNEPSLRPSVLEPSVAPSVSQLPSLAPLNLTRPPIPPGYDLNDDSGISRRMTTTACVIVGGTLFLLC